ncbi:hypothetical protein DICA0_F21638 [Diutina catenulata]
MSEYTFKWPSGPNEVIITGTFDNWGKTLPLVKSSDGSFAITVPFGSPDRVLYKYVVDGEWLVSPTQKITQDENGNDNNYIDSDDFDKAAALNQGKSRIPEAGGLAAGSGLAAGGAAATVMPKSEQKQTTLGEPGVVIPKGDQLSAFEQVRNVDPKTLNEPDNKALNEPVLAPGSKVPTTLASEGVLPPNPNPNLDDMTPEERKKHKKKVKKMQYKKKKKQQKAAAAASSSGLTTTSDSSPEPESANASHDNLGAAAGTAGAAGVGAAAIAAATNHHDTHRGDSIIPGAFGDVDKNALNRELGENKYAAAKDQEIEKAVEADRKNPEPAHEPQPLVAEGKRELLNSMEKDNANRGVDHAVAEDPFLANPPHDLVKNAEEKLEGGPLNPPTDELEKDTGAPIITGVTTESPSATGTGVDKNQTEPIITEPSDAHDKSHKGELLGAGLAGAGAGGLGAAALDHHNDNHAGDEGVAKMIEPTDVPGAGKSTEPVHGGIVDNDTGVAGESVPADDHKHNKGGLVGAGLAGAGAGGLGGAALAHHHDQDHPHGEHLGEHGVGKSVEPSHGLGGHEEPHGGIVGGDHQAPGSGYTGENQVPQDKHHKGDLVGAGLAGAGAGGLGGAALEHHHDKEHQPFEHGVGKSAEPGIGHHDSAVGGVPTGAHGEQAQPVGVAGEQPDKHHKGELLGAGLAGAGAGGLGAAALDHHRDNDIPEPTIKHNEREAAPGAAGVGSGAPGAVGGAVPQTLDGHPNPQVDDAGRKTLDPSAPVHVKDAPVPQNNEHGVPVGSMAGGALAGGLAGHALGGEKEVDAVPHKHREPSTVEEEIVVAKANTTKQEIEKEVRAVQGKDVTLEEFTPNPAIAHILSAEAKENDPSVIKESTEHTRTMVVEHDKPEEHAAKEAEAAKAGAKGQHTKPAAGASKTAPQAKTGAKKADGKAGTKEKKKGKLSRFFKKIFS